MKKIILSIMLVVQISFGTREIVLGWEDPVRIEINTQETWNLGSGSWISPSLSKGKLQVPGELEIPFELTVLTSRYYYNHLINQHFKRIVVCHPNTLELHNDNEAPKPLFAERKRKYALWKTIS